MKNPLYCDPTPHQLNLFHFSDSLIGCIDVGHVRQHLRSSQMVADQQHFTLDGTHHPTDWHTHNILTPGPNKCLNVLMGRAKLLGPAEASIDPLPSG